jgi:hypothetical protein
MSSGEIAWKMLGHQMPSPLRKDMLAESIPLLPESSILAADTVKRALQAVRSHLGMDVAYVSEFIGRRSVFREVDAPGKEALIKPGDSQSLDDVYCEHILAGRIPELMPDTSAVPFAAAMPITVHRLPADSAGARSRRHRI